MPWKNHLGFIWLHCISSSCSNACRRSSRRTKRVKGQTHPFNVREIGIPRSIRHCHHQYDTATHDRHTRPRQGANRNNIASAIRRSTNPRKYPVVEIVKNKNEFQQETGDAKADQARQWIQYLLSGRHQTCPKERGCAASVQ